MNRRGFSSCAIALKSRPVRSSSKDPLDIQSMAEFNFPMTRPAILLMEHKRTILNHLRLEEFQFKELAQLRQKFKPPTKSQTLILKSIHYQGEPHPVIPKAILSTSLASLPLTSSAELHKFKLLAGPRYDYTTDQLKISCQLFPNQNMNQKWCSDTLDKLILAAQDQTDSFADIPLDTRATDSRLAKSRANKIVTLKDFPKEWLPTTVAFATESLPESVEEMEESLIEVEETGGEAVVPW